MQKKSVGRIVGAMLMVGASLPFLMGASEGGDGRDASTEAAFSKIEPNAERNAYFGELHLHTSNSFDAYMMGSRLSVADAYRFGAGETVSFMGQQFRRDQPLDFMAVTDHAEQLGLGDALEDSKGAFAQSKLGRDLQAALKSGENLYGVVTALRSSRDVSLRRAGEAAWARNVEATNQYYRPGVFTTFIGYEWTSFPKDQNLHRNVIYRGDKAPFPFSSQDSERPEDLWSFLEDNRARGIQGIAIPHNGNASNGLMYDWVDSDGGPMDKAYAQRRLLNEPLTEIHQGKGQSETHPLLSSHDEFANFEVFDYLFGPTSRKSEVHGSYIREAFGRGLVIASKTGANPYKYGMAGGSDFHGGLSTSNENAYGGSTLAPPRALTAQQVRRNLNIEPDPQRTIEIPATGSGALTAVWAESNTRESIFDAMLRKETFATSGTRMKVRFFGGWDFKGLKPGQKNWVANAYKNGVAMGGDLPARANKESPNFVIWASKDSDGANLDRVQIVKVSLNKEGEPREEIFNVALSGGRTVAANGKTSELASTVDLKTATYKNTVGAEDLGVSWRDPAFDPTQPAVYYVRVLEIQTPRWSTILAARNGLPVPSDMPATVQERAWSSPIWYTPVKD